MNNKYIEVFISKKYNEFITEDNIENVSDYLPYYENVKDEQLRYLLAFLEYSFNYLFQYMNDKISTNNPYGSHYNAHESRLLINTIDLNDKLKTVLEHSQYSFSMDKKYIQIIEKCNHFLVQSGGSSIPEDFKKIDIIEAKPIFNFINLVNEEYTDKSGMNKEQNAREKDMIKLKNKVFIVHGHDNETKQEVARFIEKIGLQTIILHEQANNGMTIIEKIEYYTSEANFAIVLYTPCDKGRGTLETKVEARYRARQNVVFEHGYLMAKIGRKNICALVKGEIETPSDISGVVYTPLDSVGVRIAF